MNLHEAVLIVDVIDSSVTRERERERGGGGGGERSSLVVIVKDFSVGLLHDVPILQSVRTIVRFIVLFSM